MSLHDVAGVHTRRILENPRGPGHALVLRAPDGRELDINTTTNDVSAVIDPDTGQVFTGRSVQIYVSRITLREAGFETPRNIPDVSRNPWLVIYTGRSGKQHKFKVSNSEPDRTLDYVRCDLEFYE